MSDPGCVHQWQVARSHSGKRMTVCQACGRAEECADGRPSLSRRNQFCRDGTGTDSIAPILIQWSCECNQKRIPWGRGATEALVA